MGLIGLAAKAKKIVFGTDACVEKISKSIGNNNKAVIGITDNNIAKEIIKKINGGEVIG